MHLSLLPILLLLTIPAHADLLQGKVVSIADGDTLTLLVDRQQHRIRLAGIDAPEKSQAFGSRSKSSLGDLTFQKMVVADCPKTDRYGRLICRVMVGDQDVGLQQVADGMAWWFRRYSGEQSPADRAAHESAEDAARAARTGLWSDVDPVPPWEWRRRTKTKR